jgi:hypothetical protein
MGVALAYKFFDRHSREGGNPFQASARADQWIPAFAGMTIKEKSALGNASIFEPRMLKI